MRILSWLLSTVIALAVAAWMLEGISFDGSTGTVVEQIQDKWPAALIVAAILGVVSAFVKPVVQLLSLPLVILTVGLFLIVINALMLMLTGWIATQFDIGFHVDGFWTAVLGAIIISVVTWAVDLVLPGD